MNLLTVMQQISTQLDTIAGLRCFPYPPDSVSPPAAIVTWPDDITYDETYVRGMDRMTIPVLVLVGRVSDRSAMTQLAEYASGSGAKSIKAVVEAGTYTAMDTVRVTRCEFQPVSVAGVEYSAAWFDIDIVGSGT